MQHLTKIGLLTWVCLVSLEMAGLGAQSYAQTCSQPLSETIFNTYQQQLKQESFEEDRMKKAVSFIKSKQCMKVSQIKLIIQLFNFEDNQLEFAKLAFQYAHDPENYREIVALFSYAGTRKNLAKYISKRK